MTLQWQREPNRQDASARRRFVIVLGRTLAALTALTPSPASVFASLPAVKSSPSSSDAGTPAAVLLSPDVVPVWHEHASGFNQDGTLLVHRTFDDGVRHRLVLHGRDAWLWCLCGGRLSEAAMAGRLALEHGVDPRDAATHVAAFLRALYRHEFLVATTASRLAAARVHDTEASSPTGETVWNRHTR